MCSVLCPNSDRLRREPECGCLILRSLWLNCCCLLGYPFYGILSCIISLLCKDSILINDVDQWMVETLEKRFCVFFEPWKLQRWHFSLHTFHSTSSASIVPMTSGTALLQLTTNSCKVCLGSDITFPHSSFFSSPRVTLSVAMLELKEGTRAVLSCPDEVGWSFMDSGIDIKWNLMESHF